MISKELPVENLKRALWNACDRKALKKIEELEDKVEKFSQKIEKGKKLQKKKN